MPFTKLAAPKKIASLGEQVVALAPLERDRLLAAVTTDPVKLCVSPLGSGTPKTHDVSLDEAKAVALLNKDVAVVATADALWALLDIKHSPKIEQVGRDMRALYPHPSGGSAFALGWDGSGVEVGYAAGEVGGRSFVLRGDIRAASITDDRCFVIMEGGGGGQFREHPGATPESGAVGRAELPAEAAGFDRLSAGHDLCAVGKRGERRVCLLRRDGAGFSVGMVELEHEVHDFVVLETSLVTLGTDGRLRLFGATALEAEHPAVTADVVPGLTGDATAMCATSKGGARIWVGSAGGDLVCVSAAKGSL